MRYQRALVVLVFAIGCSGVPGSVAPVSLENKSEPETQDDTSISVEIVESFRAIGHVEYEAPEVSVPEKTVRDLCEPYDTRWSYPTAEQKEEILRLITKTCKASGVDAGSCKYFRSIVSARESSHRPWVRHRLNEDVSAALTSYFSNDATYGWRANWDDGARKKEDLSMIRFSPVGDEQNPYFVDPQRWIFGLGLGALNISYHLGKFDKMAPPEILCDPVINTMIQIKIARNAVQRYGAKNFVEVQAIYAGRTYFDENGRQRPLSCSRGCPKMISAEQRKRAISGDRNMLNRCTNTQMDCYAKPVFGNRLVLDKMNVEDRYSAAAEIRGGELPKFDDP